MTRWIDLPAPAVCREQITSDEDLRAVGRRDLVRMAFLQYLIREFETTVLALKDADLVHGPAHTSVGQEAVAAGVAAALRKTLTESQVLIAAGGLQAQIEATNALDGFRDLPKQAFEAEVGPYAQELASDSPDSSAPEVEALLRDAVSLGDREYEENKLSLIHISEPTRPY